MTDIISSLEELMGHLENCLSCQNETPGCPRAFNGWALPTFGGDSPFETVEVWSWDSERLLVGETFRSLKIITREPESSA